MIILRVWYLMVLWSLWGFDFWWFHAECLLVSFLVVTEKVENIGCKSTSIGQFFIFESFSSKTHQIWRFGGLGVSKRCPTWCAQQLGIFKSWKSHKNDLAICMCTLLVFLLTYLLLGFVLGFCFDYFLIWVPLDLFLLFLFMFHI